MLSLSRTLLVTATILVAGGCSAPRGATTTQGPTRYTLTAEELQGAGANNVYDAIQRLRPEFLRTRGTGTIAAVGTPESNRTGTGGGATPVPANTAVAVPMKSVPLRVYENDVLLDGPSDLRRIQTINVIEVRFVPGPEAGVRYGTNHSGGVIFVKTT